ncbi:MAG: hypothetical protein ABIP68_07165 [Ferruginibacter sp.]
MKLNFIKKIEILSTTFAVEYDKTTDSCFFSFKNSKIGVGIRSYKIDPLYTFSALSHELMELTLVSMCARFESEREQHRYLFSFDHQTFENAIQIHAQAISKFIKQ